MLRPALLGAFAALLALGSAWADDGLTATVPVDPAGVAEPKYVRLTVDLGDGRKEAAVATASDNLEAVAAAFCERHGVDPRYASATIVSGLRDLLDELRRQEEAAALNAGAGPAAPEHEAADAQPAQPAQPAQQPPGPPVVRLNVEIAEGRSEPLFASADDDLEARARAFCERVGIDADVGVPQLVSGLRELLSRAAAAAAGDDQEAAGAAAAAGESPDTGDASSAEAPPAADGDPSTPAVPAARPPPVVRLNVELPDGTKQPAYARPGDDLEAIAAAFCESHRLDADRAGPVIRAELQKLLDALAAGTTAQGAAAADGAGAAADGTEDAGAAADGPITPRTEAAAASPGISPEPGSAGSEPGSAAPRPSANMVKLVVELGEGRSETCWASEDEDADAAAAAFCARHGIDAAAAAPAIAQGLRDLQAKLRERDAPPALGGGNPLRSAVFALSPADGSAVAQPRSPPSLEVHSSTGKPLGSIQLGAGQDPEAAARAFADAHAADAEIQAEIRAHGVSRLAAGLRALAGGGGAQGAG